MAPHSTRQSVVWFVLLTFGFSWGLVVPTAYFTTSVPIQFTAVTVSTFGPLVAAGILTWRSDKSLTAWFREMLTWRVTGRWYLAAIGIPLAGVVGQAVVYALFVGEIDQSVLPRRIGMFGGGFLVALLFTGGNEEFGWRGYMLPQLQQTQSALSASLIVGAVWLVWHLPADILMTSLGGGMDWSPDRIAMRLAVIPLAVILTWLYNSTRGSVLLAMLFHAGWNSMSILAPIPLQTTREATISGSTVSMPRIALVCFMTVVALLIVFRYDPEKLSTRPKHRGMAAD